MPKPCGRFLPALVFSLLVTGLVTETAAQTNPRAHPFEGTPGQFNAITDVRGVEVDHTTLISGDGALKVAVGPVRTGVTAILPRGKDSLDPSIRGMVRSQRKRGEDDRDRLADDSGFLDGPVMITNTHSVGVVRDAVVAWRVKRAPPTRRAIPGRCR